MASVSEWSVKQLRVRPRVSSLPDEASDGPGQRCVCRPRLRHKSLEHRWSWLSCRGGALSFRDSRSRFRFPIWLPLISSRFQHAILCPPGHRSLAEQSELADTRRESLGGLAATVLSDHGIVHRYSPSPDLFFKIIPFHFVIDSACRIVQVRRGACYTGVSTLICLPAFLPRRLAQG